MVCSEKNQISLGTLTHLSQMNFPISIVRTSLFQILGVLCGIFHFFLNSNRTFCEQTVERDPDQKPCSAVSDLGLSYLPMSHKKDTRLIWVKMNVILYYRI